MITPKFFKKRLDTIIPLRIFCSGRRRDHEQGRRDERYIIEKAAPIFNMYGYEGTSMSQLTEAIGMTKGAIYGNFKDKDEIAREAFEYNISMIVNQITGVVGTRKHACDKLIAFATFYIDNFPRITEIGGCPLLNAAVDTDNSDLPIRSDVLRVIEKWLDMVGQIIDEGMRKGEIKKGLDSAEFASLFVSSIEGGLMLSKVTGQPDSPGQGGEPHHRHGEQGSAGLGSVAQEYTEW